jgi:hypothetical protein
MDEGTVMFTLVHGLDYSDAVLQRVFTSNNIHEFGNPLGEF